MPGPTPKNPATRRRRNQPATAAKLAAVPSGVKTPALPKGRKWHQQTRRWWKDIWASPMAPEFLQADVHGLFLLAVLVDDFWLEPSKELAAEIRLQRQCFGLTPIDRRRLQWEIERAESAASAPAKPKGGRRKAAEDPRRALTAVS